MDDTNLVRFMQNLVNNPEELRRYKQDPHTYLASTNLPPEIQALLTKLQDPHSVIEEVSTVFVLTAYPQGDDSPEQHPPAENSSEIGLAGQPIKLLANVPVIIEPNTITNGEHCQLLPDSYIMVDAQSNVYFTLNVSCPDPAKPGYKSVFSIMTDKQTNPTPLPPNMTVTLLVEKALLLTNDGPIPEVLAKGSYYDPIAGVLNISLNN